MSRLTEKDKFTLNMYKSEAMAQLGNTKTAMSILKESTIRPEGVFKCSFGYAAPTVDRIVDYSSKLVFQMNYVNLGITDDSESQTKEVIDYIKSLIEFADSKLARGLTPISTAILYSYLRRGRIEVTEGQILAAIQYLKKRRTV